MKLFFLHKIQYQSGDIVTLIDDDILRSVHSHNGDRVILDWVSKIGYPRRIFVYPKEVKLIKGFKLT